MTMGGLHTEQPAGVHSQATVPDLALKCSSSFARYTESLLRYPPVNSSHVCSTAGWAQLRLCWLSEILSNVMQHWMTHMLLRDTM